VNYSRKSGPRICPPPAGCETGAGRPKKHPMDKAYEDAQRYLRGAARRRGLQLNPDDRIRERIVRHLADNKERFGRYFCPCKRHYPLDPDRDPACPCDEMAGEVQRDGRCECNLFFDAEAIQAKRRPGLLATVTCPG